MALRDDDEADVDARSEPILAIVIVAGMAAMLLTPAWGRSSTRSRSTGSSSPSSRSSAGSSTAPPATSCSASSSGSAFVASASTREARKARQLVGFAALPFALSIVVTLPAIVLAFGYDWFRTGGSDEGAGRVDHPRDRPRVRALVARAARRRPQDDVRASVAGRQRRARARDRAGRHARGASPRDLTKCSPGLRPRARACRRRPRRHGRPRRGVGARSPVRVIGIPLQGESVVPGNSRWSA